jgi:hypothetical protein
MLFVIHQVIPRGYPRIAIFSKSRHTKKITAGIYLIFRGQFFEYNAKFGEKGILGQPSGNNAFFIPEMKRM